MPMYTYSARDDSGRLVKGVLEAESQLVLADRLRRMGYLVTKMDEAVSGMPGLPSIKIARVPQETLLLGVVQLANLVEAGVPLMESIETVASQTTSRTLRSALEAIAREIEAGAPLSQSLARQPWIFPKQMVSLVSVGEVSGRLDDVLMRYSVSLEKDLALVRAVRAALVYPCTLLAASIALVIFIVSVIIPQFTSLFMKLGVPLPLPTRILMVIGFAFQHYWPLIILGTVGLFMGLGLLLKVPAVRFRVDRFVLGLPVAGQLIHETLVARFTRALGTMIGAGIPILSALETSQKMLGNKFLEQEMQRVQSAVERGERIATTLSVGKVFYPDAIQMIRVGEESGRLDSMLEKISDFYELRVSYSLKHLTTFLEPVLLMLMGAIVAFIMLSLLLPVLDLTKTLRVSNRHGGM